MDMYFLGRFLKKDLSPPKSSLEHNCFQRLSWGDDDTDGVGIYNERFYENGLWNYPPKEGLKDFIKLDISSKRTDLDKTVWEAPEN